MSFNSLIFLVIVLNVLNTSYGQQCDGTGLRRYDSTFAKLLTLGGSGRLFPENKKEKLKKYCDLSYDYIQDIDKYKNKCLKQMPKQMTGLVVYSVKTSINKYCKRDSKRLTELISGFHCANRAKPEFDQCYTTLIDSFLGSRNAKEKLRIPHLCCEYYKLFECFKEKTNKNKNCNEFQVDMVSSFVRELFGSLVDVLCTDYVEGSDKCANLGSPPKKKRSQRRTKSFMVPFVDILASLPEQPRE